MPYSVKALAERWQCSPRHIYDLIDAGKLSTFSIGSKRGTRISDAEVERWESGEKRHTETETSSSGSREDGGLPIGAIRALASVRG